MSGGLEEDAASTMFGADGEVTPIEVTKLMGLTRQFVDRLCEDGVLAFYRLPCSHCSRICVEDLLEVIAERERRRAGGDAIRAALGVLPALYR